jgi:ATP-dependent RNA helicase DeaD
VNVHCCGPLDCYVHRIGRVGRAGREGVAITLAEPREQRLLSNIERLTKQQITIESVPTVADLKARRMAQTVEAVREALSADDLNDYGDVLNALSGEHNMRTIALAAIKLAHETDGTAGDEIEIPDASKRLDHKESARDKGHRGQQKGRGKGDERSRDAAEQTGYLYVSVGRKAGVRPGDLVGAIANETGLEGRQIGPILIADNFSVVGVPERKADDVVAAMRTTMIRGKKTSVRRYTD